MKFSSLMRFLRIRDWIYIIGLALLGFFYKGTFDLIVLFTLVLISSLYLMHGYTFNNCFDFKVDPKTKNPLSSGEIRFRSALILSFLLLLLSCSISFFYSKVVFSLVVLGGFFSFLYSGPPRLKDRLGTNLFLNPILFSTLFLIGFASNKSLSLDALLLFLFIALAIVPSQIIHILAHREYRRWEERSNLLLKIFHFSLFVLISWSFLLSHIFLINQFLFPIIFFFSVSQFYIVRKYRPDFKRIRYILRMISIFFGIVILFSFLI